MRNIFSGMILLAALAVAGGRAMADTVVAGGLPYNNVNITGVKGGELYWSNPTSGTETHKPIDKIEKITTSDEPALAAAEDAYAGKDWPKAAENYEKVVRTTAKAWLKDWCTVRLVDASSKVQGRFDLFITGYVQLLLKDPVAARRITVQMPRADSQFLLDAIGKVRAAYNDQLTKQQKEDLLELRYKLHVARNDGKGADDVLTLLLAVNPNHPIAQQSAMRRLLESLRENLKNRKYDETLTAVEANKDKFTTPEQQAEALFCLAEAKAGKAEGKGPDEWKDVALDYMRVVSAGFAPATPRVAEAMMKTAAILEKRINDKAAAIHLYKQVVSEYKNQPIGQQAAVEVARLEQK